MNETNFNWDDLRLFLAVARHGGLAAAEADTGKSAPTLARRMLSLERALGQELFERLPRGYVLTKDGEAMLDHVMQIEQSITPIVEPANATTRRRVKISTGTWTTYFLMGKIAELVADPLITLQWISADHVLDIPHREAVIGIRNKRPEQLSLAGRQLSTVRFAQYAVADNLDTWVLVQSSTPSAVWVNKHYSGAPSIEVTNPRNALDIALTGTAKTVLPTFIGDNTQGLQKVSDDIKELEHMQWLVTHHEDRHLPEVRRVIESVHAAFAKA